MTDQYQLLTSSILNIPFHSLDKDFTFFVNGREFKTNRIVAEIISPKVSKIRLIDPTQNTFSINTESQGDFQNILDLIHFQKKTINENEKLFIFEILDYLENDHIKIDIQENEITMGNVFTNISFHEKYKHYFSSIYTKEIDFISEHFYEFSENEERKILDLSVETIESIITNSKLQLKTESQLLNIVSNLYIKDSKFSFLFEYVNFLNVEEDAISNFLSVFNIDDLTTAIWRNLLKRFKRRIIAKDEDENEIQRIRPLKFRKNLFYKNKVFEGIFNYIQKESNGKIENEVEITSSSVYSNDIPIHAVTYDQRNYFQTQNLENSWLCFDFKDHRVFLTNYTIMSYYTDKENHPKKWSIEGSNDGQNWTVIDEEEECRFLNGASRVYTFSIPNENQQIFRFIRIIQTGENWAGHHHLLLDSIEFYGVLF